MKHATQLLTLVIGIALLLAIGFLCYWWGFSNGVDTGESTVKFWANVDDIQDDMIFVTGISENDINHRGAYTFVLKPGTKLVEYGTDTAVAELKAGNSVYIHYRGLVLETYPAQIQNVVEIEVFYE